MKYIDADKLLAEIDKKWRELADKNVKVGGGKYDIQIYTYLSIKNLITSLQKEHPKFNVGDLIVSKKNPHLTYKILATNIPNELGKMDYKVEIFTDGKPLLREPHNIHLINSDKIEDWGELVQKEQPEVELEREMRDYFSKWDYDSYLGVITMDNDIVATLSSIKNVARYFWNKGFGMRKEE